MTNKEKTKSTANKPKTLLALILLGLTTMASATNDTHGQVLFHTGGQVLALTATGVQDSTVQAQKDQPAAVAEEPPMYPGGMSAMMEFIKNNMVYPEQARKNGIQGRVYLSFVIGRNGKIRDINVVRSVDPLLDQAAIDVIKKMPAWIPGKQDGKAISVKYTIPLSFRL